MPKAVELLRQGRNEELWQMCCGFISLNTTQFMDIQERLLLQQLELLNNCPLGAKIMRGAKPRTLDEFRSFAPLTTYKDYCPELLEKREDVLPARPAEWVRTSGKSGEYSCKWIPMTPEFSRELSIVCYGVGIFSACTDWGDISHNTGCPRIVYAVAPRPYMSGAMAKMLEIQSPSRYLPPLDKAESLSFQERVAQGFSLALSQGFDYFFGLSLVLVTVGDRFSQASSKTAILPLLLRPRALFRLARGMVRSKLAKRPILPRDLWSIKGIMSGGLDSWIYKERIKELWGRYPLDVYSGTEGGIYATQTWDYDSMTFIPNLNFLEFIPEEEHLKWQMDRSYQPQTLLLDELKEGENYEIVITNFHGGALIRYRPGDMIRITSLRNEKLGINLPQAVFVSRADDIIDFGVVRASEKAIWQAIENTGVPYADWVAYRNVGEQTLNLYIETKDGSEVKETDIADAVYRHIMKSNEEAHARSDFHDDPADIVDFKVKVSFLPAGTFAGYTARKQAEGVDLAHLKPPHVNPRDEVLSQLLAEQEEIIVVTRAGEKTAIESSAGEEKTTVNP